MPMRNNYIPKEVLKQLPSNLVLQPSYFLALDEGSMGKQDLMELMDSCSNSITICPVVFYERLLTMSPPRRSDKDFENLSSGFLFQMRDLNA